MGRSAVLTTSTLSIPQQLLKSGCPSSEMSHRNTNSVVVVSFAVVVRMCVVCAAVVIGCVVIRSVVVGSVVVDSVVGNSDVVDSVVIDSVVTGIISVVVVVVLDNCSHLRQTPSALASLGRYTRWTSVSDDGNLKVITCHFK